MIWKAFDKAVRYPDFIPVSKNRSEAYGENNLTSPVCNWGADLTTSVLSLRSQCHKQLIKKLKESMMPGMLET